ncbi:MAG: NAD(P)H-hydrate dehydratase [Acidobacteria bacterium]|nr:NAD(P)H-hydrate dehydratase [Acidobacteriota bacterium]
MIKVLTAAQMREVDRLTTERYGIPSILLMENAAHAVARVITEKLGGSVKGKSVLVLCGPGNNGGDGTAVARLLDGDGASVRVIFFAKKDLTKGDARTNLDRLPATVELCESEEWWQAWEYINGRDWNGLACVVDAVFGTGLRHFRDDLNEIIGGFPGSIHVAVDIPSGLFADEPIVQPTQYKADLTITFTSPKVANTLPPASRCNGELHIADIGSPKELVDEQTSQLYLAESTDASEWLRRSEFSNTSYKNKRGHALIIAGSRNYSGAAVLCGDAAIRSGCGLVTIATPESSRDSIAARVSPEVMVRGLSETDEGSASDKAAEEVNDFLKNVDVVAIGSGLSTNGETAKFVRRIVEERTMPMLVDADALTALSPMPKGAYDSDSQPSDIALANARAYAKEASPLIFTPHEGEFGKLLGVEKDELGEILKDRVGAVRDFATRHNVILVLKGERALIGVPDGRVVVNPTGNSGLGKAGNGDTLAGILAGFLAQAVQMKIDIFETVVAAVYIAGMAGDDAEKRYGKRVMTASDVRDCLVGVFEELEYGS